MKKPRKIRMDYETFSEEDLTKVGAFQYARHVSTEILMIALAEEGEEPVLWVPEKYATKQIYTCDRAVELMESLADDNVVIYAFNSQFEWAITKFCFEKQTGFKAPRIDQFRCTAAMSRKAAIPADLDGATRTLNLRERKDMVNGKFLDLFCKLNTIVEGKGKNKVETVRRVLPTEHPHEFYLFGEYCKQDVRSEGCLHDTLSKFELSDSSLQTFLFDARMNDRGIPVNIPALHNALRIIRQEGEVLISEFQSFTGLRPTQVAKVKDWLQARGYPYDNLQADTLEQFMEEIEEGEVVVSDEVVRAVDLRQKIGFAANSKVAAMINCANADSRVRGVFMYHGARTGRWSAKYIQPQNFKRPTDLDGREEYAEAHPELDKKEIYRIFGEQTSFAAYHAIEKGIDCEGLRRLYGQPLEVISSCIRHFIHLPGRKMFDADYAAIEARIVCWLAGQEDALEKFRRGEPLYEDMAAFIFGVPISKISKKGIERFIGKQTVLGCGFGMGPPKFIKTCAKFKQTVSLELAEKAVYGYREKFDKVADLWKAAESAARQAIYAPNKLFKAGKLSFFTTATAGMKYLIMRLPSGRNIAYPDPRIEDGKITFFGNVKGKKWGRITTYGGKLVENGTQATAADIMSNGAVLAEREGYNIFALIHDEALSLQEPGQTIERFCELLKTLPRWADGLPIDVEGDIIDFYTK